MACLDLQTREWKDEDNLNKLNFLRMQISLLVPNQESWQLGKLIDWLIDVLSYECNKNYNLRNDVRWLLEKLKVCKKYNALQMIEH